MSSLHGLDVAPAATRSPTGFFDLPREVQKEIFSHCSQGDLICSSLVSKDFRELAAAQLYRNFHIVFPDEDDPSYDSPIDGLAGGLDTFVTSDYDYAKHLRDFSLDTLSAGDKAEAAYKPYMYGVSCGKFLNTLLELTLRKATSLEAFRWNIRVEISRPVYDTLHHIPTLNVVHLRLQSGPSLYEAPPPLPFSGTNTAASAVQYLPGPVPPPPPPPVFSPPPFNVPAGTQVYYVASPSAPPPPHAPPPKHLPRLKPFRKTGPCKEPPTLSGFKNLKSLSVLDIDSLDIVTELKCCVRNSASTLTKLQLSFSDYLGSQARKPPPELDPDDSDPDEDFAGPPMPGFHEDLSGPARAFRAQEERKRQEDVLGRILDDEPYLITKAMLEPSRSKESESVENTDPTPESQFFNALTEWSRKLIQGVNESDSGPPAHQELLDLIEAAARKYVDSGDRKTRKPHAKKASEQNSGANTQPKSEEDCQGSAEASESGPSATAALKPKKSEPDARPEDIDIEEPLEQLSLDPQDSATCKTPPNETATTPAAEIPAEGPSSGARSHRTIVPGMGVGMAKPVTNLEAQKINFKTLVKKLNDFEAQANALTAEIQGLQTSDGAAVLERLTEAEQQLRGFSRSIQDIQREIVVVEAEIVDSDKQISLLGPPKGKEAARQRDMTDYLRSTRGLALETLSIYLIPVKASVLRKSIDIRALRQITLLNVGPQGAIWTLFHKENKESPLALRKIFTDNVSTSFINFVSSLDDVHDLFMLERDNKYKPESFAPKTSVTITNIRRLVLKKHMRKLRRLMIKNQMDNTWDFDEKTFYYVCTRGHQLQELACSTGVKAMHTFLRKMAKLVNLRALHIVSLRSVDTCVWAMRETKEFLLDGLSHHPEMKLEWVSIDEDDKVDRILMPSELLAESKKKKKKTAKKDKGKQKASDPPTNGGSSSFPVLPPLDSWDADPNTDTDENDEQELTTSVERVSGVRFYDVWDVSIFTKEVVHGRL